MAFSNMLTLHLKGVFSDDNQFYEFIDEIKLNTVERVTVVIRLLDENGDAVMTWTYKTLFPFNNSN